LSNESNALERVYAESSEFIILGLTGRTGSGCTTAARILSEKDIRLPEESNIYSSNNDKRKYQIIRSYIKENWIPFIRIQMRVVITGILLELSFDELIAFIEKELEDASAKTKLTSFKAEYEEAHNKIVIINAT